MPPSAGYHVGGYLRRANIYYGGSFFRRPRQSFYVRRTQSLFHYPVYSKKERCPINWIAGKTLSGYEVRALNGSIKRARVLSEPVRCASLGC